MNIQKLHMPVCGIVPKFDRELAKDMNLDAAANGIVFDEIGIVRREIGDRAKTFEQLLLISSSPRP